MNLRNSMQINNALENNNTLKIHSCYTDIEFNEWCSENKSANIIAITHLVDVVSGYDNANHYNESVQNSTTNNNRTDNYGYIIKILYQER